MSGGGTICEAVIVVKTVSLVYKEIAKSRVELGLIGFGYAFFTHLLGLSSKLSEARYNGAP